VLVPEPTVDETIQILKGLRERYEIHHKLRYTDEALVAAAQLSYQYIGCVSSIHYHNKYVVSTKYIRDLNV
jgi:ATP-dependent Clp protease ATP-binding subunit ClpA